MKYHLAFFGIIVYYIYRKEQQFTKRLDRYSRRSRRLIRVVQHLVKLHNLDKNYLLEN